jgi:hypothetical protein
MCYSKCVRVIGLFALCLIYPIIEAAENEQFVSIQNVEGTKITYVTESNEGRGGRRGGGFGKGDRGGVATNENKMVMLVPQTAKITSAMRERRTYKFRVGVEIPGGLRNPIFQKLNQPLSARIVFDGKQVSEINVLTSSMDLNQTTVDTVDDTDIAVRPKRPPLKR